MEVRNSSQLLNDLIAYISAFRASVNNVGNTPPVSNEPCSASSTRSSSRRSRTDSNVPDPITYNFEHIVFRREHNVTDVEVCNLWSLIRSSKSLKDDVNNNGLYLDYTVVPESGKDFCFRIGLRRFIQPTQQFWDLVKAKLPSLRKKVFLGAKFDTSV